MKAEGRVRNRGWPGHMMTAKPYGTHETLPQEQRFRVLLQEPTLRPVREERY